MKPLETLIANGKCNIPQTEIDYYKNNHDTHMFNLLNMSQTAEESNSIENQIVEFFSNLQKDGKKITKFVAQIDYCDESYLKK